MSEKLATVECRDLTDFEVLSDKLDRVLEQQAYIIHHIENVKAGLEQAMQNPTLRMMFGNLGI